MNSAREKCLYCNHVLFENVTTEDNGHTAYIRIPHIRIEAMGYKQYCMCPRCFSKNVLVHNTNQQGLRELIVSHLEN
jgi:hypothetical protein